MPYQTTPYAPSPTTSWMSYCSDTLNEIFLEPGGGARCDILSGDPLYVPERAAYSSTKDSVSFRSPTIDGDGGAIAQWSCRQVCLPAYHPHVSKRRFWTARGGQQRHEECFLFRRTKPRRSRQFQRQLRQPSRATGPMHPERMDRIPKNARYTLTGVCALLLCLLFLFPSFG